MRIDYPENLLSIVNGLNLISLVFGLIEGDPVPVELKIIVGSTANLPCNVTTQLEDDSVTLILWYKQETGGQPIYTMDSRTNLEVDGPQYFAHQILGDRATFSFNKTSVHGSLLTIDPVSKDDHGHYKCRVDFRRGRTQITTANLFVIVPPETINIIHVDSGHEIIPENPVSFDEHTDINLKCQSSGGRPAPSLIWLKDDNLYDESYQVIDESSGLAENRLSIKDIDGSLLNVQLECQAINNKISPGPKISLTLDINIRPHSIEITNKRKPISAGRKIEIICLSKGSRPPARITWFKDGKTLIHSRESYSEDGFITTSALIFMPTRDDNRATIICKADNPRLTNSSIQDSWSLEVFYDPKVLLTMGNATKAALVKAGDKVELKCNVTANPMVFEVRWFRDGEPLFNHGGVVQSNTTLIIEKSRRKDHGKYQCSAMNIEGSTMSNIFHLEVHYPPTCKSEQKNVYGVSIGERITVSCQVEASPEQVDFYWLLNGTIITETKGTLNTPKVKYISEGVQSWLEYTPRSKNDFGTFECWSRNAIGSQMEPCLFTLIPSGPPEAPQDCTIPEKTWNSVIVKCKPGFDGGLSQLFNLQVLDNQKHVINNLTAESEPWFNISDLNPESNYILFIYSENAKGSSRLISLSTNTRQVPWKSNDQFSIDFFDSDFLSAVKLGSASAIFILTLVLIILIVVRRKQRQSDESKQQSNDRKREETGLKSGYTKPLSSNQINPDVVPSLKDYYTNDKIPINNQLIGTNFDYNLPLYNQMQNIAFSNLTGSEGYGLDCLDKKLFTMGSFPNCRADFSDNNGGSIILGTMPRSQILPRRSFHHGTDVRVHHQRNVHFGNNISGFSTPV